MQSSNPYLSQTIAIALAEIRFSLRLARTWVFLILAALLVVSAFIFYTILHGKASGTYPFAGFASPRYILGSLGATVQWIFLIGAVFLAFDARTRDTRERIHEVIDSRPVSNFVLLLGRLVGITALLWFAALCVLALVYVVGASFQAFTGWMGGVPQMHVLFTFLVIDCLPAFLFFCAVIVFLAIILKLRLAVAATSLTLIGLLIAAGYITPGYLLHATTLVSVFVYLPSEVSPIIAELPLLLQRAALLLFAVGLISWAAALHPRREHMSRLQRTVYGAVPMAMALCLIAFIVLQALRSQDQIGQWKSAHAQLQQVQAADLERIDGEITILPGRRLELDLRLTIRQEPGESLLFTLNPRVRVDKLKLDGNDIPYTHENGALVISAGTSAETRSLVMDLQASGSPDRNFAYLDSPLDPSSQKHANSALIILGQESLIFRRDFVALMPGTHWLPTPGSAMRGANPEAGNEYFHVDLTVEVPAGWTIAGPGLGKELPSKNETVAYRFRPSAPMSMVGLVASKFHRTRTELHGVELVLLLDPHHRSNLEILSDSADAIKSLLGNLLKRSEEHGLGYPYGGLTMVEVPNTLRVHGSGWDAPSIQALPGLLMMREHSFPTARLDTWLEPPPQGSMRIKRGDIAETEDRNTNLLNEYLSKDSLGGNPFLGYSRNCLAFVTSPRGAGAPAIDYMIRYLSSDMLTGKTGAFSAYSFLSSVEIGREMMSKMWGSLGKLESAQQLSSAMLTGVSPVTTRSSDWDAAQRIALTDLDYANDPNAAIGVVALRGELAAKAVKNYFGQEKVNKMLGTLREKYAGKTYSYDEFRDVAIEAGLDLDEVLGDWLSQRGMPGFLVSSATGVRLPDAPDGTPRYQTSLHIHNSESVPGLLELSYSMAEAARRSADSFGTFHASISIRNHKLSPVSLAGNESVRVSWISTSPLESAIALEPYLALNRSTIEIDPPSKYHEAKEGQEAAPEVEKSSWRPVTLEGIVVDDLDSGFGLVGDKPQERSGLVRLVSRLSRPTPDIDGGLPAYDNENQSSSWTRRPLASSWGKYRKTVAYKGEGRSTFHVEFMTNLPGTGQWQLHYHVPRTMDALSTLLQGMFSDVTFGLSNGKDSLGEFTLRIESRGTTNTMMFDAGTAKVGWNAIGVYDLDEGPVTVAVIPTNDVAIADAIRWTRIADETPNEHQTP